MTGPICSVDGCTTSTAKGGKGMCGMHRLRARRGRDLTAPRRVVGRTLSERIYGRLTENPTTGCWEWTGALRNGYGAVGLTPGAVVYVHRWVYEDMVADLPPGLVVDHLCANRKCANPYHLDPVTRAVNNARGDHGLQVAS